MSTLSDFTVLLFDLDGTLTDSAPGITNSVRHAISSLGLTPLDDDTLRRFVGPPLHESFIRFCRLDAVEATEAVRCYREYYAETGIFENSLYEGIIPLLEQLKRNHRRLFVATSKPAVYARQICHHFGIDDYFEAVEGSELDGRLTDKGELIRHLLDIHQISTAGTLMIGDREHDVIGAQKNGIPALGAGYGYGTFRELTEAGVAYYAATVQELADFLLRQNT